MSEEKSLVVQEQKAMTMGMDRQIVVTPDQMATIKNVIFPDATDDELKLFIYFCQRKGTHPMDKLIHPVKRGGKVAFQSSIDYLRAESESAGDYRGMKQPVFDYDDHGKLESATVTVLREIEGHIVEFTATAYWDEFFPGEALGFMWKKMPRHMLAKCAEALARRQAWPKKLADLYTPEEMAQADNDKGAAGNRQAARAESVQPARKKAEAPVVDAQVEEMPLDDEIQAKLAQLCGGDYAEMDKMLKACSYYKKENKEYSFGLERLASVSAQWKQKALVRINKHLEELGQEREPGAEG